MSIQINTVGDTAEKKRNNRVFGICATFAAFGTYCAVDISSIITNGAICKKIKKLDTLAGKYSSIFHEKGEKALEQSGLADKVKINYLAEDVEEKVTYSSDKSIIDILKSDWKDEMNVGKRELTSVKNGLNSFFTDKPLKDRYTKEILGEGNSIYLPKEKGSCSIFHEIGHAMNYNLSKHGKIRNIMSGSGHNMLLAIGLYSLFSQKSKTDENENYTKGQKVNNFVRNNAGTLAFATFLPNLVEEASASIKGIKLAKNVLPSKLLNLCKQSYKVAFLSYFTDAALTAIAIHAGVKIKDKLIEKKEAKLAQTG